MSTNRPFFANFLAAFRAHHSALTKTTTSPPSVTTVSPTTQFTLPSASTARTISTSTSAQAPLTQTQSQTSSTSPPPPSSSLTQTKSPSSQPSTAAALSAAAASSHLSHHHHHHHTRHPSTSPPPTSTQNFMNRVPQRRGSDSSSEGGFREVLGGEKWYIGGRTATGEERFYRLGMVRGERSWERRSCDRLSL
ncbi:MAG: hypothetical protein LQ343_003123 [Gyalolechia ehrenbergii]|nr:MAG: hypothetical protein LQ343_003123 [Gyalolechia ehrenbergii]